MMRRNPALVGLAILGLCVAGCGGNDTEDGANETAQRQAGLGPGVNDGSPDLTPATLTPEAERGEEGARNVLLSFVRGIELKEFDQAWSLMRPELRENLSREQFTQIFAGLGTITVAVPGGTIEGAAGTSTYTVPATINGSNGGELTGKIVLSRVNDVPGAAPEDLQWRVRTFNVASR